MIVAAGRATIRTASATGRAGSTYSGTVDAAGELTISARLPNGAYRTVSGTIQGGNFTGESVGSWCSYTGV
jgi:hypothetical protein